MNTAHQPYLHFQRQMDEQQLCWLTIDVKDRSTNVLSREEIGRASCRERVCQYV